MAATALNGREATVTERARAYLARTHTTMACLAREIHYSMTMVSQYMAGKYEGNTETLETKLQEYLEAREGAGQQKRQVMESQPFFHSADALVIYGVCGSCQEDRQFGVIVGKSGYGKTYTLKQYAASRPQVAYVECDDTMGLRDLVEAIEDALGIPNGYESVWKRVKGIRDYFNGNKGYLLIIDEADKLISQHTQKKMEVLRAIFDQASVGIVIAGEPKLEALIRNHLERLANRVDCFTSLAGLSSEEVEQYLIGYTFTEEAMAEMKRRAGSGRRGCFRLIDRTMENLAKIADLQDGQVITLEMIQTASGMMMM
jgi:DNA transposition AAA+ family ATPase